MPADPDDVQTRRPVEFKVMSTVRMHLFGTAEEVREKAESFAAYDVLSQGEHLDDEIQEIEVQAP